MLVYMQVSRLLPWTIKNYKLDEIVTLGDLRRNVSLLFRQHAHVTDPKVDSRAYPCACAIILSIILVVYRGGCSVSNPYAPLHMAKLHTSI